MKVQKSSGVTNNTSTQRSRSAPTISDIRSGVEKYMVMGPENDYIVDLLLAVALSKETDRPLWLMIVAPPSSGKTEMLRLISTNPEYHQIPSLTPRFLFSGHPTAQGGYMLREVGKKGILAFPDFTTVLSMSSANRREIFNQLRVIHDGEAGRGTGIDIGEAKIWKGKVAVVACVTDTIERIREQSNDLGERFLYYRYNPKDPEYAEISSRISPDRARLTVQRNVKRFVRIRKAAFVASMASRTSERKMKNKSGSEGISQERVAEET